MAWGTSCAQAAAPNMQFWWLQMSAHRRINVSIPPSRAGSLDLVGRELAWDFTNTSSGRGSSAKLEHLRDFGTLMQWVEHARVMPPSDCAYARAEFAGHPRRSRRILERAIAMRELIWTIGTALAEQRPVSGKLLELLSAAHAENLRHAEMKMRFCSATCAILCFCRKSSTRALNLARFSFVLGNGNLTKATHPPRD